MKMPPQGPLLEAGRNAHFEINDTFTVRINSDRPEEPPKSVFLKFTSPDAGRHHEDVTVCFLRDELQPENYHKRIVFDLGKLVLVQSFEITVFYDGRGGTSKSRGDLTDTWHIQCDARQLQKAMLKLMDNYKRLRSDKWGNYDPVTMSLRSFNRPSRRLHEPQQNWVQICKRGKYEVASTAVHFRRKLAAAGANRVAVRPMRLPENLEAAFNHKYSEWERTYEACNRYSQLATLYGRGDEFYFDGRHVAGGCGFNGGIILHGDSSVGIHT